jgi:hypothetical protein
MAACPVAAAPLNSKSRKRVNPVRRVAAGMGKRRTVCRMQNAQECKNFQASGSSWYDYCNVRWLLLLQ